MKKAFFFILSLSFLFGIVSSCKFSDRQNSKQKRNSDLARILKSGKLIAVVDYNSTNYFIYKGKTMGFEYELLNQLAEDMGVKLEIVVSNSMDETFEGLNKKKYDLIAKNLTVTKERGTLVDFTKPIEKTRQVLVQRKPDGWEQMNKQELENHLVRDQLDLANKKIIVQKNTAYYSRLQNLSDEIGEVINVVEDADNGVEQLVYMVSNGEIPYTVCDENVARVNQTYYPNIDVETPISFNQNVSWAIRKNSPEWLSYLNNWIINYKQTAEYRIIYRKYFENSRSRRMALSNFHSLNNGSISPFDEIIKEESEVVGIDWRLTAAVIYQESQFNQESQSWAGAYGLMQVMPETADMFRINDLENPRLNIRAGLKVLTWLNENLLEEVSDSTERIKFVLAAYNVGLGHVKDAMRLADKYHKTPSKWDDNVDYFLLNLSSARFYKDKVVKYGYCRGNEPYNYVNSVLTIYQHYKNALEN